MMSGQTAKETEKNVSKSKLSFVIFIRMLVIMTLTLVGYLFHNYCLMIIWSKMHGTQKEDFEIVSRSMQIIFIIKQYICINKSTLLIYFPVTLIIKILLYKRKLCFTNFKSERMEIFL